MVRLKQIEEFLGSEPIALAGVSRNPRKFGYAAFKELKDKGLNVIPVNPFADEIYGTKVYPDIKALPADVKGLIIMTKKEQTPGIIREAKEKGIKQIWVQQMADSNDAIRELENSDINYITKECILMYYKPNSIHKFHRAFKKFFGRYPK
jgi:predicted CoA-binding protein